MTDSVLDFYEQLAADYHLLFTDWGQAIERQGAALDRLIRAYLPDGPVHVLDCSCGIGTQAIGLAQRGYTVHATDFSPRAVERAALEATRLSVPLTTGVADFRTLAEQVEGTFDVVISCDNSVTHLLDDADLALTAQNMHAKLRPDGLLLLSIRDYDHLTYDRPRTTTPTIIDEDGQRRVVFQVWDWAEDGQSYTLTMFIVQQDGAGWSTKTFSTTYRALLRGELTAILEAAGFRDVRWHMPQDTGYYQPVVAARRA